MALDLANSIARECLAKFDSLPKTGKPDESFEWTILAGVVLLRGDQGAPEVVALGTGTKCLGGNELSQLGDRVNDSHAEVLARRAFLRYLYDQIELAGSQKKSIFERSDDRRFMLRDGHSFHFFTTHTPCGDASIFKQIEEGAPEVRDEGEPPVKRFREIMAEKEEPVGDVVVCASIGQTAGMTGGKLLLPSPDNGDDLMIQTIGAVRTKPGRGVRTLSVSCSDKMARWAVVGVQGALLMLLLEKPIYFKTLVLCDDTDHSVEALRRAIWGRMETAIETLKEQGGSISFPGHCPDIVAAQNGLPFRFRKNRPHPKNDNGKYQPSPCGIVWCAVSERPHEVEISGRRHGVTKRKLTTPTARLRISKIELFASFLRTYERQAMATMDDGRGHSISPNQPTDGGGEDLNNLVSSQRQQHNRTIADHQRAPDDAAAGESAAVGECTSQQHGGSRPMSDIAKLCYSDAKALSADYRQRWISVRDVAFGGWTEKPAGFELFHIDGCEAAS
ncbi:tRNA-specific adenosine deaminase 1 [Anopheles aquasalis]|uniref:tRNA-specific adenosine deaminase 1 n=1 Tax=Anopheles aquasalis TaxID=42839 RepID=UPI00215A3FF1|nr:tRNA-specific adenosine deaminase 1 [Anopheles aquasalis]